MRGFALGRGKVPTACLLLCCSACSGENTEWISGTRMTVHWEHVKDAAKRCRQIDPSASGPVQACRKREGTDCYVYTGERAKYGAFGELVQNCFEVLEFENE